MTQGDDPQGELFYAQVRQRITWFILVLGISGALIAGIRKGWGTGLAFLIGAAISYLSFWRWEQIVSSLGSKPNFGSSRWWMLRSIVLVLLAYVIIRVLGLNLVAALVGLLVSAAAVMLEIIYELIYGGT
jgi:hypothetical protein